MIRAILLATLALAACYDIPRPECGFVCGANNACPDGYTCGLGVCRLDTGTPFFCPEVEPPDAERPGVQARAPEPDEREVDLDRQVFVTFDRNVRRVSESSFLLLDGSLIIPAIVEKVGEGDRAFRLTPTSTLRANASYTVELTPEIVDGENHALAPTSWSFSTVLDGDAPMVTFAQPATTTDVPVDAQVLLAFTEGVVVPTGSIRLETGGLESPTILVQFMPNVVTLDHAPFTPLTLYTIVVTAAVTDLAGNPISPVTSSFTTADTSVPP